MVCLVSDIGPLLSERNFLVSFFRDENPSFPRTGILANHIISQSTITVPIRKVVVVVDSSKRGITVGATKKSIKHPCSYYYSPVGFHFSFSTCVWLPYNFCCHLLENLCGTFGEIMKLISGEFSM